MQVSRDAVRKLAIENQQLASPGKRVDAARILDLVKELGCLQIDPISIVAPPQLLILWSRLGSYNPKLLERIMWKDRSLFHYWAHAASLVPTADYPVHAFT